MAEHIPVRERIKDLNTKAYYLLVALSFMYFRRTDERSLSRTVSDK